MNEKVLVEPALEGTFQKFNSNWGQEQSGHEVPRAFTHWVFEASGREAMVCDLQGVCSQSACEYQLTDPVIHTVSGRYESTKTDLGVAGMATVLLAHRCGDLCRSLGLRPMPSSAGVPPFRASGPTMFQFNLSTAQREAAIKLWCQMQRR